MASPGIYPPGFSKDPRLGRSPGCARRQQRPGSSCPSDPIWQRSSGLNLPPCCIARARFRAWLVETPSEPLWEGAGSHTGGNFALPSSWGAFLAGGWVGTQCSEHPHSPASSHLLHRVTQHQASISGWSPSQFNMRLRGERRIFLFFELNFAQPQSQCSRKRRYCRDLGFGNGQDASPRALQLV